MIKNTEITAGEIVNKHKLSADYKASLGENGLFEQTQKNERFYVGDQWLGKTTQSNLQLIVRNFIKRILKYQSAQLISNPLTATFSAEGVPSFQSQLGYEKANQAVEGLQEGVTDEFDNLSSEEKANLTFNYLSKYYESTAERLKLNQKFAKMCKNAQISGTGCIYAYWDDNVKTGLFIDGDSKVPIIGDVEVEVIDAIQQVDFENPACEDVQKQDYIIISKKVTVEEAKRIAKANGLSEEEISKIKSEESSDYYSYERDENLTSETVKRTTVYTYFFKEYSDNGTDFEIHAIQATSEVIIKPEWNLQIRRYPIALFRWEERENCIFGDSEVTYLIPNQIAVNKMSTASYWSAQLTGMPIMVIDKTKVSGTITNQPGQIWEFNSADGNINNSVGYIQPPPISTALSSNTNDIIQDTMQLMGANDTALGNMRADNSSAIIALLEAANAPMQVVKERFIQSIDDIVRIIAEFWVAFYGQRKLKIQDKSGNWYIPFDSSEFSDYVISVKIDVGSDGIWSKKQEIELLKYLFESGVINGKQFLEKTGSMIRDVNGLIREIEQIQSQNAKQVDPVSAIGELTPQEQEQFGNLDFETQQQMIQNANDEVSGVGQNENDGKQNI